MFNLGWTEILIIATIAIIIVGPRDLPGMLRSAGQLIGRMRRIAGDFQKTFNDAIKDAERQVGVDEIRKGVDSVKQLNPVNDLKKTISVGNLINPDRKEEGKTDVKISIKPTSNNIEESEKTENATPANVFNQSHQSIVTNESAPVDEQKTTVLKSNDPKGTENSISSAATLVSEKSVA